MSVQPPLPGADLDHVLQGTAEVWPDWRGRRFFVTGATGFFGRWMLESLLAANRRWNLGLHVTALSRDPAGFCARVPHLSPGRDLEWMTGSVQALDDTHSARRKCDVVIHLATEGDLGAIRRDPTAAAAVIADGTRRVLAFSRAVGAQRLLFTSSGSVYGRQPADVLQVDETCPTTPDRLDPANIYAGPGRAKREAESLCEAAVGEGIATVIARGFTFAGPALPLDGKFAFGNFLRDALGRRTIVIEGDGTPVRSYLYAADLAVWLWIMLARGKPGRSYNLGAENAVTLRELAEAIARELGSPGIEIRQAPTAGASHRYVPSTRRAREELGLRETFALGEMIRRTAAWHRIWS